MNLRNYILLKPDPPFMELDGILLDIDFRPEIYMAVSGVVVWNCDEYIYSPRRKGKDMHSVQMSKDKLNEWDVDVETKVGDRVIFRYVYGLDDRYAVTYNGERHLLIPYNALVARLPDFYPLNGYTIVRHLTKVDDYREGMDNDTAVVVADGMCKRAYLDYPNQDLPQTVGAKVLLATSATMPFEYFLFKDKGEEWPLSFCHKKEILAEFVNF